jgi:hypothetical protein
MARAKSKSGRKGTGGRKTAASARRKTGAQRKVATKRGRKAAAKRGARRTSARKTRRKATGRKTAGRKSTARKAGRSSGQRGRKRRASQAAASQATGMESDTAVANNNQVEGEGSYTASRHFRTAQTDFVRRNRSNIGNMGKEAEAALEGPQGDELRAAEDEARSHAADGE